MVEILAVGLTGATLSAAASSFFDADGPPPAVGQLLIAFDPGGLGGAEALAQRVAALAEAVASDGDARLPGSRRIALRQQAAQEGVLVDEKLWREVSAMAQGAD
jgi:(2R)-3-sulfolactate dehydrogenase (NADP+)